MKRRLTLGLMLGSSLFLLSPLMLVTLLSPAFADTLHLYNGQVVEGKILDITGDIIVYRSKNRVRSQITRMELSTNQDMIETVRGQHYIGHIVNKDPGRIELQTAQGLKLFYPIWVSNIVLGKPAIENDFIETPHQMQQDSAANKQPQPPEP
ncbi:MAG: hypothetical protein K2X01_09100 [Cyanobacteria bacterium]|nr:hypothetical protein [Cyanobacteriota bacterium]